MSITFIGDGFFEEPYGSEEKHIWKIITEQISKKFPKQENLIISTTWFGAQFTEYNDYWEQVMEFKVKNKKFHNLFLISTVDPPMFNDDTVRDIIEATSSLFCYKLGNFDSPHHFNFFSIALNKYFTKYTLEETSLNEVKHIYVNYNRKPKVHRIKFVEKLYNNDLLKYGTVTLGKDSTNIHNQNLKSMYLSIGETHENYSTLGNDPKIWGFGIPQDYFSLHRMDIWNSTFLYINGATEFVPRDDLFCQQDVFKPLIGMRPFVINGVQKTYHWLRYYGFKTFNHYWKHIDIENGNVHDTIIELIQFLSNLNKNEIMDMYKDMLLDLNYNKERFYEFANEQQYKVEHLF